jgi:TatD DNase family protein
LVDSHAHLDSSKYDSDRDALLERAWQQGVDTILSIGIGEGPDSMHGALEIARRYGRRPGAPRIFATAGIHPHEAQFADEAALAKLGALLGEPEVIAAGEIGLDYYYDHSPRERQQQAFFRQMEIAALRKRPIVIHCRPSEGSTDAWEDTLMAIESQWARTGLGGVLHCFTGEWEHARRAMDCGFLISFAGNITFPKADGIRSVAARIPLDRLLIETDAPFLAPVPHRGRRNEPAFVPAVAAKLAEVRGTGPDRIASDTARNFFRFFDIAPLGSAAE